MPSSKRGRSIAAPYPRVLNLETQNHISIPVSIDISQGKVYWSCLSASCTKTDCVRVNGSRVKPIVGKDRYTTLFVTVGIDSIRFATWPYVYYYLWRNRTS